MSFDETQSESSGSSVPSRAVVRERNYTQRLNDEVKSLEERLKRKKRLKELLDSNPVIREALELMN